MPQNVKSAYVQLESFTHAYDVYTQKAAPKKSDSSRQLQLNFWHEPRYPCTLKPSEMF